MTDDTPTPSSPARPIRPRTLRAVLALSIAVLATAIVTLLVGALTGSEPPTPTTAAARPPAADSGSGVPAFSILSSRPPASLPTTAPSNGSMNAHGPATADSPRIASLRERAAASGADPSASVELARALVDEEHWVESYRLAEEILAERPGQPDALWVRSVVRLRMGQNRAAIDDLEGLVADHPDHVDGLHALGLGLLRVGRTDDAVRAWEQGLAAAGGRHEELERLLSVSRAARTEKERAG